LFWGVGGAGLLQMAGRTIYVRLDQDNAIGGMGDGQSAAKKLAGGGMGAGMGAGMYGGGVGMGGTDSSIYGMWWRRGSRKVSSVAASVMRKAGGQPAGG
jgi:hypothetical protein